eukprot:scaffold6318_cov56-Phaeocystis_antarctica.AAC.3
MPSIAAVNDATEDKAQHHAYHPPLVSYTLFHPPPPHRTASLFPHPAPVLLLPGTSRHVMYAGGGGADRAAPHRG